MARLPGRPPQQQHHSNPAFESDSDSTARSETTSRSNSQSHDRHTDRGCTQPMRVRAPPTGSSTSSATGTSGSVTGPIPLPLAAAVVADSHVPVRRMSSLGSNNTPTRAHAHSSEHGSTSGAPSAGAGAGVVRELVGGPRVGGVRPTAHSQTSRLVGVGAAASHSGTATTQQPIGIVSDNEFSASSPLVFADSDDNR